MSKLHDETDMPVARTVGILMDLVELMGAMEAKIIRLNTRIETLEHEQNIRTAMSKPRGQA